MKLRVIVTGATGMVGEGVLEQCLLHPDVEQVLVLTRRTCGITHPRLKEIIHSNFLDISPIEHHLNGYNACFFCLGVSSVGMSEADYTKQTYQLTLHVATVLSRHNPDMTFIYVSGAGTDSTERGRQMWARVKGKTENDLMKLPFKKVYAFRPGIMRPSPGAKFVLPAYKYVGWLFPVIKALSNNLASELSDVGIAMIKAATQGYEKPILEVRDINQLAKR